MTSCRRPHGRGRRRPAGPHTPVRVERVIFAFSRESGGDAGSRRSGQAGRRSGGHRPAPLRDDRPNATIQTIEGLPLLGLPPARPARSSLAMKRVIDVVAATAGLLLLSPILVVIAIAIRLTRRGRPFIARAPRGSGVPFRLFEFRSMYLANCRGIAYGARRRGGVPAPDQRIRTAASRADLQAPDRPTRDTGRRVLRRTSFDELPQLVNVVLGDMSLVATPVTDGSGATPKPQRSWPSSPASPATGRSTALLARLRRPGEARERLRRLWSLRLDWQILAKTVRALLSRSGAF